MALDGGCADWELLVEGFGGLLFGGLLFGLLLVGGSHVGTVLAVEEAR